MDRGLVGRRRQVVLTVTGVIALVLVWASRQYPDAATFPKSSLGKDIAEALDSFVTWVINLLDGPAGAFKDFITTVLLNPLQALLADSPWYVAAVAISLIALALGGMRALVPTVLCLAGIRILGLWHDAMITLNMTLVATLAGDGAGRRARGLDGPASRGPTWCCARCSTPARRSPRSST